MEIIVFAVMLNTSLSRFYAWSSACAEAGTQHRRPAAAHSRRRAPGTPTNRNQAVAVHRQVHDRSLFIEHILVVHAFREGKRHKPEPVLDFDSEGRAGQRLVRGGVDLRNRQPGRAVVDRQL